MFGLTRDGTEGGTLTDAMFSLGVTTMKYIRNEQLGLSGLETKLRDTRLKWFGHAQRRDRGYILDKECFKLCCQAGGKKEDHRKGSWMY